MPYIRHFFFTVLFFIFTVMTSSAKADIYVDVNGGVADPLPIAVLDFEGDSSLGKDFTEVISNNLSRSGLFRPISHQAFVRSNEDINTQPHFNDWQGD